MTKENCFHCDADCGSKPVVYDAKNFCCNGCKTVFEIFNENDLTPYYDLENAPGKIPEEINGKYNYLDDEQIIEKLYDFKDGDTSVITFYIPHIHCSSCIWVLENLNKLSSSISTSQVNFPKKEVRITFNSDTISLKQVVELLSSIGYEPLISLEDATVSKRKIDRSLIYKLGVAGFAFGNIMLLSFPEYFQSDEYWLERFKPMFRLIIFIMILPVVFYSVNEYFISAYKGLKHKILNIDVPIVLGIVVLFLRSSYEIFFDVGQGYFDSLSGFVFFLLLGKIFQQQTYSFLSFERDYKSYFPVAVTKIFKDRLEKNVAIYDVKKGDRLLIRDKELIPVDGILISGNAQIDYSFVTGESLPVTKNSGDKLFAGGKQISGAIEMEILQTVSQSYLTQLWSNDVFGNTKISGIKNLTDSISKRFTIIVLIIAFLAGLYWYFIDVKMVANVVTAVLIVACPCALALSAPFALGNMLRIFGRRKLYLKNVDVIENLSKIDIIIFDKTGTITNSKAKISYSGTPLAVDENIALKSVLRFSNHPLSRMLYDEINEDRILEVSNFNEVLGKGLEGKVNGFLIKIGSAQFVNIETENKLQTQSFVSINGVVKGKYIFENSYRNGLDAIFNELKDNYELGILSGDNDGEKEQLKTMLPKNAMLIFNKKPVDKLNYIKELQDRGKNVLMIGDGLNDAGALVQSNVGLVVSENINVFSPASDGIVDATEFKSLPKFLKLSQQTLKVVKISFVISILYNIIGMLFAITGNLSPIVAAILMPLSSITIVIFVTLGTNLLAKRR
ncbi:heavy metal translocating P-type ATPase metal-binding domain-containing protein [Aureibaculum sp. 2210JD6-5]|uniref:heavy metal translocating P-type ATPase n=1 Tax=Aureibaculum sp. 2210JD6-5 TaxID=3103957 RepID=UPI002AACD51B|nr:heavy metal translocating P-type ATPase metal-binding domain-containing protein [Aureibaculum sp. 2210JD6-5]MDY7396662.1 heavy metal translocating P-type ATPase metal-binding domain-containing protein [Aureibaculum sp. 2210JD6-5]